MVTNNDVGGSKDDHGESSFLMQRRMQALALSKGIDLLGVDLENEDHKQYVYHQLGFSAVVPQQIQLLACIKQYQEAAKESIQQRTLCSLIGITEAEGQEFDTYDQVLKYFEDCFHGEDGDLQLSQHNTWQQSATSNLIVKIPTLSLHSKSNEPDMLRFPLPVDDTERSSRLSTVLKTLGPPLTKHVFASAVSGAGKTRLCYDVAHEKFACYFDLQGTVKQKDVGSFIAQCERVVLEDDEKGNSQKHAGVVLDHLIASLLASRLIAFGVALRTFPDLQPADWLSLQTDFPCLTEACYRKCVELKLGCLQQLVAVLRRQENLPLLLLDEAQVLLRLQVSPGPDDIKQSLGCAVVAWLNKNNLVGMFSGSNLRMVREFSPAYLDDDASCEVLYDFDFLKIPDVQRVLDHYFDTSEEPKLGDTLALLQGRPLFVASAVQQILLDHDASNTEKGGSTRSIAQSILAYTNRQIIHPRSTLRSNWENVYQQRVLACTEVSSLWSSALVLLTNNLFTTVSDDASHPVTRPFNDHGTELVSCGLTTTQKMVDGIRQEVLVEPLVLSAGLTFCCTSADVIMEEILVKLLRLTNAETERQRHDKLLKLQLAVQVFQVHEELLRTSDWPESVQIDTAQRAFGILVGVPLSDPRLNKSASPPQNDNTDSAAPYWMALPDSPDGPDILCPQTLFSMTTTPGASSAVIVETSKEVRSKLSETRTTESDEVDSRTDESLPDRSWIKHKASSSTPARDQAGKGKRNRRLRFSLPSFIRSRK